MTIKHWLLPTKKNGYHPHLLKTFSLFIFMMAIAAIPYLYNITSTNQARVLGYGTNINVIDLLNISNQERLNVGLKPLKIDNSLSNAAEAKARHMFANNYWAHVAPDGTTPWSFFKTSGYNYHIAGENLAKGFDTSEGVVNGWMNSQTHKDNVLGENYEDVGYAVLNGTMLGEEVTLVVAMYGVLQPATPIANTKPETSSNTTIQSITNSEQIKAMEKIFLVSSIEVYESLNWGQKLTIAIALFIATLMIIKHAVVLKVGTKGIRYVKFKPHPLVQAIVLITASIATIISSIGVVL